MISILVDILIVSSISLVLSGIYYPLNGRTLKSMYKNFFGRVYVFNMQFELDAFSTLLFIQKQLLQITADRVARTTGYLAHSTKMNKSTKIKLDITLNQLPINMNCMDS